MSDNKFARRVSMFILKDKDGRVLLQYRDKTQKMPEHWAFLGGGIDEGETPEQALKREAKEELGIDLTAFNLFKRYEFREPPGLYEKFMFVAPLRQPLEQLKKQQKEGKDLGLFSFDELKGLKISDNDMVVLKELFGISKK